MRLRISGYLRVLFVGSILLGFAATASAQFRANVQGTVADTNGAVIVGATVTLTNKETGKAQQTMTTSDGFYRFSNLPPGNYKLEAEHTGFRKRVLENLTVSAEQTQGADFILEPGDVTNVVTVTEESASPLQTENADISNNLSGESIRRLPLAGRDPYEAARLTPGVFGTGARGTDGGAVGLPNATGPGGSSASIFQTENQVQISANGQRISGNNFQIDGVSVNSLTHGGAAVVTPNQESVKEIRVTSSSYSAEDGRNSGAQIKIVSQGGMNEWHGSAFFKYDDPDLNAFNKFPRLPDGSGPKRVERLFRNFGGSLGGPLYLPRFGEGGPATLGGRNKSFFFFSYEGFSEGSSSTGRAFVETPQYRAQVLSLRPGSVTARILGAAGVAPRILNVLQPNCIPFNNDPNRCRVVAGGLDIGSPAGGIGQYLSFGNLQGGGFDGIPDIQEIEFALPKKNRSNQYNLRLDFTPTSKDQLTFSSYFTTADLLTSDGGAGGRPMGDVKSDRLNTSGTFTYVRTISSTMVNEARFNFTRFSFDEVESAQETNFGIPRIEIETLPFDRIRFGPPWAETTPGVFAETTLEFRDNLTKVFSNHAFKFGFELRRELNNDNLNGGSRPLYTFAGLFNFANDAPLFYQINADPRTGGVADAKRRLRENAYGLFAQDDWKVRPNLTLNLGLRYEYFPPPSEADGKLSNLVFAGPNTKVVVVDKLYQPDRNDFAPVVGFAWSPGHFDNKLVLRGGFRIAYNRVPGVLFGNTRGNPPFFVRYRVCCGTSASDFSTPFAGGTILYATGSSNSPFSYPVNPALAAGIDAVTGAPPPGNGREIEIWGAPPEVTTPYVYSFSFEGQYELPYKLTAEAGYQGSRGRNLVRIVNERFVRTDIPAAIPAFSIFFPTPDVRSWYNALNARLGRRFSQGFQFDAIYRFSRSIDELSNEGPGAETNQTNPGDLSSERGRSDFDVTHNFVMSGSWDFPVFRNRRDTVGKILGGWQLSGIMTWNSGFPWTAKTFARCQRARPGVPDICPGRPLGVLGEAGTDTSNSTFLKQFGNFPGGPDRFFVIHTPNPNDDETLLPPGIGRNTFPGPKYFNVDLSFAKRTELPRAFGEGAYFEVKANFFNAFNNLNLAPFRFFGSSIIGDANFGRATAGLAGRVIELQGRFSF